MNHQQIDIQVSNMFAAISADNEDDLKTAVLNLAAGFLKNVARIADAMETIAKNTTPVKMETHLHVGTSDL